MKLEGELRLLQVTQNGRSLKHAKTLLAGDAFAEMKHVGSLKGLRRAAAAMDEA
jgi:hypothetical protein